MGVTISSFFSRLFGRKEIRIAMFGLDDAGKTTILYKLKIDEIVTTIPTIGFNVETLTHKNISFVVSDVAGGSDKLRPLYFHYYELSRAVIFVVDSTNSERIEEAKQVLQDMVINEHFPRTILVLGNKHDLPNAMTSNEIIDKLKLNELSNHKWHVQLTSATQGRGLNEALDWLVNELVD